MFQFARDKEAEYRRSILRRVVLVSRIGLAVGAVAIPAFIFNDLLFDAQALTTTLPVRLAIAIINASAFAALFHPGVRTSPAAVRLMMSGLFLLYSFVLVLISAGHAGGMLINVPGYVQVMVFIPLVCFSFLQALGTLSAMVLVAVLGSHMAGATETELLNLANWLADSSAFVLGAAFFIDRMSRRSFELEQELAVEKARSDALLQNILPDRVAERLKRGESPIADDCACATVLFADIAGFTAWSRGLPPGEVVEVLNDLFSRFDTLSERYGVEKIKTIGDGYMAVAGLRQLREAPEAARAVANLALDMQESFTAFRTERGVELGLRIGVHSGPVVSGVIGVHKIAFDLWGDTVNIASRLETACTPGAIQISAETAALIGADFDTRPCGEVKIAGHDPREVYQLKGRSDG